MTDPVKLLEAQTRADWAVMRQLCTIGLLCCAFFGAVLWLAESSERRRDALADQRAAAARSSAATPAIGGSILGPAPRLVPDGEGFE